MRQRPFQVNNRTVPSQVFLLRKYKCTNSTNDHKNDLYNCSMSVDLKGYIRLQGHKKGIVKWIKM